MRRNVCCTVGKLRKCVVMSDSVLSPGRCKLSRICISSSSLVEYASLMIEPVLAKAELNGRGWTVICIRHALIRLKVRNTSARMMITV